MTIESVPRKPAAGMPPHNPPYRSAELSFRTDLIKLDVEVNNPAVIREIIPPPLHWHGQGIIISGSNIKESKGSFSPYLASDQWREILIQIPVLLENTLYYYNCDIFTNHYGIICADREMYGFPKIPAKVEAACRDNQFAFRCVHFSRDDEILNFEYRSAQTATTDDLGPRPRILNYKFIPGAETGSRPESNALISMKYARQIVHDIKKGTAEYNLGKAAPDYLRRAGLGAVRKALSLDLELHATGGRIVHDYSSPAVKNI